MNTEHPCIDGTQKHGQTPHCVNKTRQLPGCSISPNKNNLKLF
jgi:hypothetical protein